MPPLPPVTQALLLAHVAVYFLFVLLGGAGEAMFALWPIGSGYFMPWQVVTYSFLHGGFGHLFFNMIGLWMFGGAIEQVWGGRRMLAMWFTSVLAAAACQLIVQAALGSNVPTVGASGGVYGVLLCFALLFPNQTIMLNFILPMKAKYLALIYGGLELMQGAFGRNEGVAHFAHLGGMLGAFLLLQYWRGRPPFGGFRR